LSGLLEDADHLAIKCREIVRLAARYELSVDNDLLIHPIGARIPKVILKSRPACDLSILH
jgi:hypothetical protein